MSRAPAKPVVPLRASPFCCCSSVDAWRRADRAVASQPAKQKMDEEYTAKIKEYTQDPRITTELVDHLPASDTVPTPLKFFGRMPGTPGELTYAKDIQRYYEALDKASDRITMWTIGKTEEGRDMVLLAVADEATIKQLDKYKGMLASLTDPRKTTEEQAQQLIRDREADLLDHERHALARDRRAGDAASSCRTGSRSRRRRSSRRSATTSSRSSRRSSRWTAARSRSTPTTSTRSGRRATRGCR